MTELPEEIAPLLARFAPDEMAFFSWIRPQMTSALLRRIAAADYDMETDAHYRALQAVYRQGALPVSLHWIPREVLDLTCWSEPEHATWEADFSVGDRHLMRAFSCDLLLRAAADPRNADYFSGENTTLIQWIASALALGSDATVAALQTLLWRVPSVPTIDEERPFYAMGVLLLAAARLNDPADAALLNALCAWVEAEEAATRYNPDIFGLNGREAWLLGLTSFDQRHARWRTLAQDVLTAPTVPVSAVAALTQVVERLDEWQTHKDRV